MQGLEQLLSVGTLLLVYIDCTATYLALVHYSKYNCDVLFMEQNLIARAVFKKIGLSAGYFLWTVFAVAIISSLIYYADATGYPAVIWALAGFYIVVVNLHGFNFRHMDKNTKYRLMLVELGISQEAA